MWWRILEAADREKIFMGNACIMPVLQGDFVNGNFLHSVFAASIIKDKKVPKNDECSFGSEEIDEWMRAELY